MPYWEKLPAVFIADDYRVVEFKSEYLTVGPEGRVFRGTLQQARDEAVKRARRKREQTARYLDRNPPEFIGTRVGIDDFRETQMTIQQMKDRVSELYRGEFLLPVGPYKAAVLLFDVDGETQVYVTDSLRCPKTGRPYENVDCIEAADLAQQAHRDAVDLVLAANDDLSLGLDLDPTKPLEDQGISNAYLKANQWVTYLSASGYMDRTDYEWFDTEEEALQHLIDEAPETEEEIMEEFEESLMEGGLPFDEKGVT